MTSSLFPNGLPARQWTILGIVAAVLIITAFVILTSCKEKMNDGQIAGNKDPVRRDSLYKPRIDIQVNKHFDKKGNMIGFDSTYSTFYSNMPADTIRKNGGPHAFNDPFFFKPYNGPFLNDSSDQRDFFRDDFFFKPYDFRDDQMRLFRHMDSIRNHFFQGDWMKEKTMKQDFKNSS
jgi:hypothetical protein